MLALGFDHVSDDDYARVTIAQSFAHAPRLDPTGTSWLPFPFWALGSVMAATGRSLAVARGASIAFASLAMALLYMALCAAGMARRRAMLAVALAAVSPWSLWLGAATVPESFTASLTAAAAVGLGAQGTRSRPGPRLALGLAAALLAASLSRYEAWPVAAVLAAALAFRGLRAPRRTTSAGARGFVLLLAAIAAAGPPLWMAWNLHAHGDALHFFARVSDYKRALGAGSTDTWAALMLYPRLLVAMRPDVLVATLVALGLTRALSGTRTEMRQRWLLPLLCAAAQLVFLAYGNARDGAPAHHSERALLGIVFILATFAIDAIADAAPAALARSRPLAIAGALALGAEWVATTAHSLRDVPGQSPGEDRTAQIVTGQALRAEGVQHLDLTPCAYEHFALIAAFAAPERVTTRPRTGTPPTTACPSVERR